MVTRVSGLNSGMDIDGLVTKLMTAERAPFNTLSQKQQKLTWTSSAYRDMNAKISAFRDSLSTLRFGSNWAKTTSTSSDSTKVSATSTGSAAPGTHNIVVTSLARAAQTSSTAPVSPNQSLKGTSSILTGANISAASNNNSFNVTLNGTVKTVTIADGNYTDNVALETAVQSAIDKAFGANQIQVTDTGPGTMQLKPTGDPAFLPQLKINAIAGNTGIASIGFTDNQSFKLDAGSALNGQSSKLSAALTGTNFTINSQQINYDPTVDSLSSIISKVNNSSAGVTMSYDSVSDKISISGKSTGVSSQIVFGAGDGNFLNVFKLSNGSVTQGQNAQVTIDNVSATYSSNAFTSNGVTYSLNSTTSASGINVNVSQDTDSIYNQISDFVNKYNDLIGTLNTKLNEPKYKDYQPLTSDQKTAMSEKDIATWEEKAKSGLLANDNNLQQIRDNIRLIAYSSVTTLPTDKNALYKIGITTQPYVLGNYADAGKLQIDSTALKAAISNDPQSIINLFTNQPGNNNQNEKGIFQQMYESADKTISNIIDKAGKSTSSFDNITNTLGLQIHNLNNKILDYQAKLNAKETYYYQMFAKMDTAIGNSNAQMSWLQSQLPH